MHPGELIYIARVQTTQAGPPLGYQTVPEPVVFDSARDVLLVDDFTYGYFGEGLLMTTIGAASVGPWTVLSTNGGQALASAVGVDTTERCNGVVEINTGASSAAGMTALFLSTIGTLFGSARHRCSARVAVPTLSTAAQEFDAIVGYHDLAGTATRDATDGAYFLYDRATFGNVWVCVTASNGVRTSVATAVAPTAAFQWLTIDVAQDGSLAWFSIDGVHQAVVSTNIPTAAGRQTGFGMRARKTVGTTLRAIYCDVVNLQAHGPAR